MSAVETYSASPVARAMDATEARELTERIRTAAESLWALLLEAHERYAWKALGYGSWRDYAQTEFGMSQSRAYQILDQGRVVRAIEAATGSTSVELTEAAARDLKPQLEQVTAAVSAAVEQHRTDEPDGPAERVAEVVRDTVKQERARIVAERLTGPVTPPDPARQAQIDESHYQRLKSEAPQFAAKVDAGEWDIRQAVAAHKQRQTDLEGALRRRASRLEQLVVGWVELVGLADLPERDQVLDLLIDHDLHKVLEIEDIYLRGAA